MASSSRLGVAGSGRLGMASASDTDNISKGERQSTASTCPICTAVGSSPRALRANRDRTAACRHRPCGTPLTERGLNRATSLLLLPARRDAAGHFHGLRVGQVRLVVARLADAVGKSCIELRASLLGHVAVLVSHELLLLGFYLRSNCGRAHTGTASETQSDRSRVRSCLLALRLFCSGKLPVSFPSPHAHGRPSPL